MILGIDPKVDYAFKHLFGREATRPILMDLLDNVLDLAPGREIRDLELLNPFNPKEALDDKLSILDIKARDQSGRQFNVEMQMVASRYFEKRIRESYDIDDLVQEVFIRLVLCRRCPCSGRHRWGTGFPDFVAHPGRNVNKIAGRPARPQVLEKPGIVIV